MKLHVWLLVLASAVSADAQRPSVTIHQPESIDMERAAREGQELTARLLSRIPAQDYTNTGTLTIRQRRKEEVELPVKFTVRVNASNWVSTFEVLDQTNKDDLNVLSIVNEPDGHQRYYRGLPGNGTLLTATEVATLPFAGSDFWVEDLGLDFLHWPIQHMLKKELRRTQSCYKLESVNPDPPQGGYARVVSWLDIDSVKEANAPAIVIAEAYDSDRKMIKEFRPKSLTKGQIREMEMEDFRTDSRTTIRFEFDEEK